MDYESLLELVKKRRSIRGFKPEPIPDECVDKIIEVARWAPSGANSQPWEFIVIKKQAVKDKIAELIKENSRHTRSMEPVGEGEARFSGQGSPPPRLGIEDAPVYIMLYGDTRTKSVYPTEATRRAGSTFTSSLASAFLYMHLAATALGLASQWVSATVNPVLQRQLKEFLGIPEELEIHDMMAVGYAAAEPRPRRVRAKEKMVHYDYYDKNLFRTEGEIKEFATTHHHHS